MFWKIELYLRGGERARYGVETQSGGLDMAYHLAKECHTERHGLTKFFGCSGQVAESREEMDAWTREPHRLGARP